MLKELIITNLALIERLQISFREGLTVLTGETGTGKSIILQAIDLLYGGKGSSSWIRSGADKAEIEALFDISADSELRKQLADQGFDNDETLIIKRVLVTKGRSRFYVNGSLASAKLIGELTENLVSVASQHEHQRLLHVAGHMDFLDSLGNIWPQRLAFGSLYETWQQKQAAVNRLQNNESDKELRKEFLAFQLQEIQQANIHPGEEDTLLLEKKQLKSADELNALGRKGRHLVAETVTAALAETIKYLGKMASLDESVQPLADRAVSAGFELEDIASQLLFYLQKIPDDPGRLEEINARIDLFQQLKRKYGGSLQEVINRGESMERELAELENIDARLAELVHECSILENSLCRAVEELSRARREAAVQLEQKMMAELSMLSLPEAEFSISCNAVPQQAIRQNPRNLNRTGGDTVEFLFSANRGEPLKPLAAVASGGELSRLMLALRCILARKDRVKTVILDEIDAGLGGQAAEAIARKIKELSAHHQVFSITHLPQIAVHADDHYQVTKKNVDGRTITSITGLDKTSQVLELARMLKGDSVTPGTIAYAEELLNGAQRI